MTLVDTRVAIAPFVPVVTVADAVTRGKREVLEDVVAGRVPSTVKSYSELHDYVDANEYGGACSDFAGEFAIEPANDEEAQKQWDYWNAVQGALDEWIKAGGINRELPAV